MSGTGRRDQGQGVTLTMGISTAATGSCQHVDDEPRPEDDPRNRSISLVGDMDGARYKNARRAAFL